MPVRTRQAAQIGTVAGAHTGEKETHLVFLRKRWERAKSNQYRASGNSQYLMHIGFPSSLPFAFAFAFALALALALAFALADHSEVLPSNTVHERTWDSDRPVFTGFEASFPYLFFYQPR